LGSPSPNILATFGVGAQWPLELDSLGRGVVHVMRGDNLGRSDPPARPSVPAPSGGRVRPSITGPLLAPFPNAVRTGSAAAMCHPGHHEDPVEIVRIADGPRDLSVIVEAILGGDGGIVPSGILDDLAVVALEARQVGIDGTQDGLKGLAGKGVLLVDVDAEVVAGRTHPASGRSRNRSRGCIGCREKLASCPRSTCPSRPRSTRCRAHSPGRAACFLVVRPDIDLSGRLDLSRRQAGAGILAALTTRRRPDRRCTAAGHSGMRRSPRRHPYRRIGLAPGW